METEIISWRYSHKGINRFWIPPVYKIMHPSYRKRGHSINNNGWMTSYSPDLQNSSLTIGYRLMSYPGHPFLTKFCASDKFLSLTDWAFVYYIINIILYRISKKKVKISTEIPLFYDVRTPTSLSSLSTHSWNLSQVVSVMSVLVF